MSAPDPARNRLVAAAVFAALALAALVLAGCGNPGTPQPASPPVVTAAPAAVTAAPAAPVTSAETTITYNGQQLNCQETFDLDAQCSAGQQKFFDRHGAQLPAFVNRPDLGPLGQDAYSFEDRTFAVLNACTQPNFTEFVRQLALKGNGNYVGLNVRTDLAPFYTLVQDRICSPTIGDRITP